MSECNHKFETIEKGFISYSKFFGGKEYWRVYILRCKNCGNLKHMRHSLGNEFEMTITKLNKKEVKKHGK